MLQRTPGCWSCECLFADPFMAAGDVPSGTYNPQEFDTDNHGGKGKITSTGLPGGEPPAVKASCYKWSEYGASCPASTCSSLADCAANGCDSSFHCVDGKCMKLGSKSSKGVKATKGPSAKSAKGSKVRERVFIRCFLVEFVGGSSHSVLNSYRGIKHLLWLNS